MKNIVAVSLDTVHTSKLINEKVIINIKNVIAKKKDTHKYKYNILLYKYCDKNKEEGKEKWRKF